jgi:transcriptional regulator with XRE-family HTH domain
MPIGTKLKAWRESARMTQKELAAAAGVSVAYISNLERNISYNTRSGTPRISEDLCARFAKALDLSEDEVREEAGYMPRRNIGPVKTVEELFAALDKLGVKGPLFHDPEEVRNAPPEVLQNILNTVALAVEIEWNRLQREHDANPTADRDLRARPG